MTLFANIICSFLIGSVVLENLSPSIVYFTPPEKLVLEIRASGGYDVINWIRDNRNVPGLGNRELVNFHEVFYREPTTTAEYGRYDIYGNAVTTIHVVAAGMLNEIISIILSMECVAITGFNTV